MQVRGEKEALHRSCVAFRSACLVFQARRNPDLDPGDSALSAIHDAPWAELCGDTHLTKIVAAEGNPILGFIIDPSTAVSTLGSAGLSTHALATD